LAGVQLGRGRRRAAEEPDLAVYRAVEGAEIFRVDDPAGHWDGLEVATRVALRVAPVGSAGQPAVHGHRPHGEVDLVATLGLVIAQEDGLAIRGRARVEGPVVVARVVAAARRLVDGQLLQRAA